MSLAEETAQTLSERGLLALSLPGFCLRRGQLEMAEAVASTLERGGALVVEAGTGIGKTFAYLVPSLLSGRRILISTATKTLQDQLFKRDLPQLLKALGLPTRIAILKGRSSYLCMDRLAQTLNAAPWSDPRATTLLARVAAWSRHTETGDLAELSELDERSVLVPRITSTRENCTGSDCPSFQQCHVNVARREAMAADVLVVNHHLFFSDLVVRETGMAEFLPTVHGVIFDEAHQLNDIGVQFLGCHLSTGQLTRLLRDCLAKGQTHGRGFQDWHYHCAVLEQSLLQLRGLTAKFAPGVRLAWPDQHPEGTPAGQWQATMENLKNGLGALTAALDVVRETHPEFVRLHARTLSLHGLVQTFLRPRQDDCMRWLETGESLRLIQSPVDIAGTLRQGLSPQGQHLQDGRALVFTSASLGMDADLSAFTQSCGLDDARVIKIASPFDYATQAACYVPRHLPDPSDPAHSVAVASLVASIALAVQGRTLVLTTSLRALSVIAQALQTSGGASPELEILVQGQRGKQSLIERFRLGDQGNRRACVMVASASFWEGLDLPGDVLKVVVIDKLPFPSLSEPLVQARAGRLQALGRNVFREYYLPEAAISLRQGAGRLIRSETDRGLLVICDRRLHEKSYGQKLLAALPPMRQIEGEDELQETLQWLTRPSTMGLYET